MGKFKNRKLMEKFRSNISCQSFWLFSCWIFFWIFSSSSTSSSSSSFPSGFFTTTGWFFFMPSQVFVFFFYKISILFPETCTWFCFTVDTKSSFLFGSLFGFFWKPPKKNPCPPPCVPDTRTWKMFLTRLTPPQCSPQCPPPLAPSVPSQSQGEGSSWFRVSGGDVGCHKLVLAAGWVSLVPSILCWVSMEKCSCSKIISKLEIRCYPMFYHWFLFKDLPCISCTKLVNLFSFFIC